jgi:hypothetical protein
MCIRDRSGPADAAVDPDRLELLKSTFVERKDESATILRSWLERDVQNGVEMEGGRT